MEPDSREVCICFHVPLGKLVKYHRLHQPKVVSDFAQCHGAGTGCGWCVPFLQRLFEQLEEREEPVIAMPIEEYKERRKQYYRTKKPDLPPPADAEKPIELNLDELLNEMGDELKLD